MGYKILGYAVWNGLKWYFTGRLPSRRVVALAFVAVAITALAAAGAKRQEG